MTKASAYSTILTSSLVVGGVYAYRRFTEGTAEELKASTQITPLPRFLLGWGVVFVALSALAPFLPSLAGHMALLLMLASLLANGIQVSKDIQAGLHHSLSEREARQRPPRRPRRGAGVSTQQPTTEGSV